MASYAATQAADLRKQNNEEEAKKWDEGGIYRIALHTAAGALGGGASGAAGAATSASAAPLMNQLQDGIQERLQTAGLSPNAAKGIAQGVTALTAAGVGAAVGGAQGAATALTVDANNRQLHPSEEQWLKSKAKEFAKKEGISDQQALERLTQQALKEVDYLWRAHLADGNDPNAKAFLSGSNQTFTNDLGEQQRLFTAQGQQLFRPEMFADTANPAFYRQFAQSGINRSLTEGLMKEAKDSGVDLKNGAVNLAKAIKDNPTLAVNAVWNAVKGLPEGVVNSFKETGTASGEGAAVALNPELTEKLNAIYGTDTAGMQKAMLGIRIIAATTGAAGTAKAATGLSEGAAKAVGKKLDEIKAEKDAAAAIAKAKVELNTLIDDAQQYDKFRATTQTDWDWQKQAPNGGAVPGTTVTATAQAGDVLDRYGSPKGSYLSPAATPYSARSLPPGKQADPYNQYTVLKPFDVVKDTIAPAFDQPGLGVQLRARIPEVQNRFATVEDLVQFKYLKDPKK